MINAFETLTRLSAHETCFTYVSEEGFEEAYSYREVRMMSAALASILRSRGAKPGDCIAVDLGNCPLYIFLILACAYGGFQLVALNHRLTRGEKAQRIDEIDRTLGTSIACLIDDKKSTKYVSDALQLLSGLTDESADENQNHSGVKTHVERMGQARTRTHFMGRQAAIEAAPRSTQASKRPTTSQDMLRRHSESARQDRVEEVIHFAEHAASVFDASAPALIMFTSGTTGRPKAVSLTWENLISASRITNEILSPTTPEGSAKTLWQACLPLFHIGGFQIIVRSLLAGAPFALYQKFDAQKVLEHGRAVGATHISVVDKMLKDLLALGDRDSFAHYQCILLGGGPLNPSTIQEGLAKGVSLYASYGMTETSAQIACAPVTADFKGGLRILPGYEAQIVDRNSQGVGRLAVRGPGVFAGYLNARAAFTVDGFFLTGDSAALYNNQLYVKERTTDMFISGGENIYPAEICQRIMKDPRVSDAYVFGAQDVQWGRRPVAFVERNRHFRSEDEIGASQNSAIAQRTRHLTNHGLRLSIKEDLQSNLSKLYQPKHLFVVDKFPRSGIGKVNRKVLEESYQQRIQAEKVVLYRIRLPFKKPFKTSKETLRFREVILVEVTDHNGRTGLGECSSFLTDWYLPETLNVDEYILRERLAPLVLATPLLHPSEAESLFATYPELEEYPLARAAIEEALWDLYGKIVKKPLWQLLGGDTTGLARRPLLTGAGSQSVSGFELEVPAGAVIGVGSVGEVVASARQCVEAGYSRLKLKVIPSTAYACTEAVRELFPDIMLSLDANQSFTFRSIDELRSLDAFNLSWIEEPLAIDDPSAPVQTDIFARLSHLQSLMKTPICVDESIEYPRDLSRALQYPNLKCYAVKLAKFGGIEPTLQFMRLAKARGMKVWMSGMYESGIGRRISAAFETLPIVDAPGDIGSTSRYYATSVSLPLYATEDGYVKLNPKGYDFGIGCEIDKTALQKVLISRVVLD